MTSAANLPPPVAFGFPDQYQEWRGPQVRALTRLLENPSGVRVSGVNLPVGSGKCHGAGVLVLMYDGSIKAVEDVAVGDALMGPDSSPRIVLETHRGKDDLYRIIPVKGDSWTVNSQHTLTLVKTQEDYIYPSGRSKVVDVDLPEWQNWAISKKANHKLFRVAVFFPPREEPLPVSPYFLGVLLGDGSLGRTTVGVTKNDQEVIDECVFQSEVWGVRLRFAVNHTGVVTVYFAAEVRGQKNPLLIALRELGVMGTFAGTKSVPRSYLVASREDRLSLLAGLLDTDGSLDHGNFDFISKSRQLSEDVIFLSRSVGLAAYLTECVKGYPGFSGTYWRVSISGDLSIVPTRIPRKQGSPRLQKKDVLRTGFRVESAGFGPYYGFTVTGDGRYVLGDFTVTHNSLLAVALAMLTPGRTAILMQTKGLQDQYHTTLTSQIDRDVLKIADIRGQNAYQCKLSWENEQERQKRQVDTGVCHSGIDCKHREAGCLYFDAADYAVRSGAVVSNYAYWMVSYNSLIVSIREPVLLESFNLLICDEADELEDALSNAQALDFNRASYYKLLPSVFAEMPTAADATLEQFIQWARRWHKTVMEEAKESSGYSAERIKRKKELGALASMFRDLSSLSEKDAEDWVIEQQSMGPVLTPIWPGAGTERLLLRGIPRVVLMSGTLSRKTMLLLGFKEDDEGKPGGWEFLDYPSPIPASRRRIVHIPTVQMRQKMADLRLWTTRIDQIIAGRLDRKTLLHTVSYDRARAYLSLSRHRALIVTHEPGSDNVARAVAEFRKRPAPAILVSPSLSRGYDFPGDQARVVIMGKVPLMSVAGSALLRARRDRDPDYLDYLTELELEQQAGRAVRSESDWAEMFVVDDDWLWFWKRGKRFANQYMLEMVEGEMGSGDRRGLISTELIPAPPSLGG